MTNIKILIGLILLLPFIIFIPIILWFSPTIDEILILLNFVISSIIGAFILYRFGIKMKKTSDNLKFFKKLNKINIKILEEINDAHTYEEIFQGVIKTLIDNNIVFAGAGYLYNKDEKIVIIKYITYENHAEKPEITIPLNNFIGKHCVDTKKYQIIFLPEDKAKSFYMSSFVNISNYYIYFFPIFYQNEIVGVLECCCIEKLNNEILNILKNIISHVGVALNQIKLHGEAKKLSKELEKKNKILEAQNKELQAQSEELQAQTEELRAQKMELEEYSKKLQQVQKYKSDFIANMSHELRTPLNSIIGLTELLLKESKDFKDDVVEKLKIINTSGKQLLNIINDILDLSKIESGKIDIEKEKFNIREIIEYVSSIIKPQCENKNLKLNVNLSIKNPFVESDRYKITQILLNVLSNAVKYTEKGHIDLIIKEEKDYFIFEVKDTGIGIPEKAINEIFEPYFSLGKKLNIQGTGLGLPLTKKLVVLLGGKINVKSKVGEGTTITITIPRKLKEVSTIKRKKEEEKTIIPIKLSDKPKILIADDDLLTLHELTKLIKEISDTIEIITATDGLFAKKVLEKENINLILLDLDMPKLSGYNLLDYIKEKNMNVNVIIVTALDVDNSLLQNYPVIKAIFIKGKDNRLYLKNLLTKFFKHDGFEKEEISEKPKIISKDFYNILVVEDNFANRYLIKEILKSYNLKIDEAENGKEALEKLSKKKYDIVLLDIQMPVMNGYETFDKIRNEIGLKDLPVIALTAKALKSEVQQFIDLGFNDVLTKPINLNKFLNILKKYLNIKRVN